MRISFKNIRSTPGGSVTGSGQNGPHENIHANGAAVNTNDYSRDERTEPHFSEQSDRRREAEGKGSKAPSLWTPPPRPFGAAGEERSNGPSLWTRMSKMTEGSSSRTSDHSSLAAAEKEIFKARSLVTQSSSQSGVAPSSRSRGASRVTRKTHRKNGHAVPSASYSQCGKMGFDGPIIQSLDIKKEGEYCGEGKLIEPVREDVTFVSVSLSRVFVIDSRYPSIKLLSPLLNNRKKRTARTAKTARTARTARTASLIPTHRPVKR